MEIFLFILKFIRGQAVEFRSCVNSSFLFLDFVVVVLHEVPMSSEQPGIPLAQTMLAPTPGPFLAPSKWGDIS